MNQKNKKGDWYDVSRDQLERLRSSAQTSVEFLDRILQDMDRRSLTEIQCQNWSKATTSIEAYNRALGAILTGLIKTIGEAPKPSFGVMVASDPTSYQKKQSDSKRSKKPE